MPDDRQIGRTAAGCWLGSGEEEEGDRSDGANCGDGGRWALPGPLQGAALVGACRGAQQLVLLCLLCCVGAQVFWSPLAGMLQMGKQPSGRRAAFF